MIGKILGGRYEILKKIGGGGMAKVYKAKCSLLNRFVAIKVLKDEFNNNDEFIRKFKRESLAAASISHQNIVGIYDVGEEVVDGEQVYYIVMEYVEGKTLKEILNERGKLSRDEVIDVSIQIANALSFAHSKGVIHRDIKPQNILITDDGIAKVTDFGIAKATTSMTMTATSDVLGSVHYFSPEQARGGYTDEKSDIYSLGIVMYEMLTGKVPYDGESPIQVAVKHINENIIPPIEADPSVDHELSDIIMNCVQKIQSDRYSSIDELLLDLKALEHNPTNINSSFNEGHTVIIDQEKISRASKSNRIKNSENARREEEDRPAKKNKSSLVPIALGILCAFIFVGMMFMGYNKIKQKFNQPKISDVEVPKFLDLTVKDAEELAAKYNISIEVKDTVNNDKFGPGKIVSQSVDPGTKVKSGYTILVNVNSDNAVDVLKIPSLLHIDINEAKSIIEKQNFRLREVREEDSETVPKGYVIDQNPKPGVEAKENQEIDLVVSKGISVKTSKVPDLTSKTVDEANRILGELGLSVGQVLKKPNDSVKPGTIFWQDKEVGTELENGTKINVYVAEEKTNVENNENNQNNNTNENNQNKPETKTMTIILSPKMEEESTRVKIVKRYNGESTVIHDQSHNASDGDFSVTVSGPSGTEFDIYYDGVLTDKPVVIE